MPTYATEAELVAYAAGTSYAARLPAVAADRNRLLELAEHEIDQALGAGGRQTTGTALLLSAADVAALPGEDKAALSRSTCAQALYRIEMGDDFFVRAQREKVSGRNFSADGKLPIVGPGAWRELTYSDLLELTTNTSGRGRQRASDVGWRDY